MIRISVQSVTANFKAIPQGMAYFLWTSTGLLEDFNEASETIIGMTTRNTTLEDI
jgi:hypothetical protein